MKTQKALLAEIELIMTKVYGYDGGVVNAPSEIILWSIDHLMQPFTNESVKKVITKINNKRYKVGRVGVHVPYGHRFF